MGQFSKKVVSTVATLSTVLSSVGVGAFAVPSVASAATLMNGDLIKASGPAVYYFQNNRRYVFPNETTYRSWFSDFSGVRTISDSELSAIMIGGNVTIRPGTNLVKITTDPKVYAVTRGGMLRWVETESVATALFGSNWARRVVDVPDAFFVNYTIGSSLATAVHPDGSLVSYSGSSDRYVVWGGMRRRITDAGFSANMFQSGNVIQTTISYPMGTDVNSREAELSDAIMSSGGSTTPVGGALTVSLASDSPAAMVLPKNAQSVMFTKVNLMAGSGSIRVTGMKFRRVGVGSTTDFSNVYLYKADGTRLTSGRTISSASNTVEFNGLMLDIAAGMTQSVYVSADLSSPSSTGGQHAFELADAASVVVEGSSTVSGSFPVRGNAMTVGTASVARVDVIDGSEPANPRVGTADAELANFRLQANGSNDVEVRRVTLYQAGTISNSDLTNLKLYQGATEVAAASTVAADGKIVLNFATPFVIPNGQSRTFNLRGMVAGRSGRTIRIYAEYTSDVYVVDRVYGTGAQVCTDSTSPCSGSYDGSSATTSNASYSTTEGGQFTITYNGPATANVGRGQNDAVFYRFAITSGSNDVEIRRMNFAVTGTVSGVFDGTTEFLRDIKIKDADTGEIVAGPVSCSTACAAPGYKAFSPSVSVTIRAGQTRNFVITADTSNSITDGSTYRFALGGNTSDQIFGSTDLRILSSGEFLTTGIAPNTTVTGNTMTVRTPTLNVALAGTPSADIFVKNQMDIPAAGFTFTAGSQSAVRITSLKFTGFGDAEAGNSVYSAAELDDVVNSCGLFDGATAVGTRLSPSSDGTMTFSGLNLQVNRGMTKTLEVRCNADSSVSKTTDRFAIGIDVDADVAAQDEDGNTVTASRATAVDNNASTSPTIAQSVRAGGTLTVAANNQRQSTILVADGTTWHVMSRYRADAQYEAIRIDYVGVTSTGAAANFTSATPAGSDVPGGVAVVQSADADCRTFSIRGTTSLPSGVDQPGEIDLSSNPIVVPKGSATYVCLLGRMAERMTSSSERTSATAPLTGNVVALGLPTGALTVGGTASTIFTSALFDGNLALRATGDASGERVYQASASNIVGNSFVVRKSKPVISQVSGVATTLAAGQRTLYRAQVGSEGGEVGIKQMTFKVAVTTTSNMTLGNFRLQKNGVDMNLADIDIRDAYGTNLESSTVNVYASTATATMMVLVRFSNEETVSGTGSTFSLVATVGGLSSTTGDSISTSLALRTFSGSVSTNAITGYLAQSSAQITVEGENAGLVGISATSAAPTLLTGGGDTAYALLWSDKAEQPHYSNIFTGSESVSRDWTNEYLVDTISGSVVLSK